MFERWFSKLHPIIRWPDSLIQSLENPTQPARFQDDSAGELEYPTQRFTAAEDRRHAFWILLFGSLVGMLLFMVEHFLARFWLAQYAHSAAAAAAMYVFLVTYLGRTKPWWRWPLYLVACPVVALALLAAREPYFILALAMLFAVVTADMFATHYFYLKTAVPMSRDRARRLRGLWSNRFRFRGATLRGVEFYKTACLAVPAVCLFLLCFSQERSLGTYLENLPLAASGFALLLIFPLALEALAAFLFSRQYVSPRLMLRAFRQAAVQWLVYNRHEAIGPATLQTPPGTYRQRRRMTLAVIALFSAWTVTLFSFQRDQIATSSVHSRTTSRHPRTAVEGAPVVHAQPSSGLEYLPSRRSPRKSPAKDDTDNLALEPAQKAMLERMPPDKRELYLETLRKDKRDRQARQIEAEKAAAKPRQDAPEQDGLRVFYILCDYLSAAFHDFLYPLLCMLVPPLYLLACCFTTAARVVGFYGQQLGTNDPQRLLDCETWDDLVNRLQASQNKVEKFSLLLGVNAFDDTPVIVPREVFQEHAHLLGDSGSGKTSLGLASLITQFIRFKDESGLPDSSVVILDLKGDDLALFEGARIEAERAGLPFRWFTNELHRSTYVFNPLTQRHLANLTLYQRADILSAAMGLQYGTEYGRGYFSDANAELLYHALDEMPDLSSFADLREVLKHKSTIPMDPDLRRAASHLGAVVSRLAACEPLNASPGSGHPASALDNRIEFADLFHTPQVLYFYLPSSIGSSTAADIARVALYSLLSAAKTVGPGRRQVYLFIDEFQRIIAGNLEIVLQTARSMNIGVILANQTLSDLKVAGTDLIPTVRANTRFKQVFAASDLHEQQAIIASSGETLVFNRSWTDYIGPGLGAGRVLSATETITPRLRPNDVLLASDHPLQSIVYVTRGKGYAQYGGLPFIMTSAYHTTYKEYDDRRKAPWPEPREGTITPPLCPQPIRETPTAPETQSPRPDPVLGTPPPEPASTPPPPILDALDAHWRQQQAKPRPGDAASEASDADDQGKTGEEHCL